MNIVNKKLELPEGTFDVEVLEFTDADKIKLKKLYKNWRSLCDGLNKLGGRRVNLPEGISETAFCIEMKDVVRVDTSINGANSSFDCYNLKTKKRIQIKACSVLPDLTSFGPKSVWDEIYFLDFYREGNWDGTFDIYLIKTKDIYDHKVNEKQTLRDQQLQGRRPRFSIYKEIIQSKKIKPIKTGHIF